MRKVQTHYQIMYCGCRLILCCIPTCMSQRFPKLLLVHLDLEFMGIIKQC